MSHEVETMFYAGETPWHKLGTHVDSALTSADAIKMAGLDWEVVARPIYTADCEEIPNYKANTRSFDGSVLGIVTDRYAIVQNADAFSFTDSLLGAGVRYETAGSLSGGKRIWLLARMPDTKILGETVEPYLVFTNAHDGKGAIKVAITPIRVVCQNTLTLALTHAKRTWTAKHMGSMDSKLREAQLTLGLAEEYMEELEKTSDELTQIVVLAPQFADFVKKMFPMKSGMTERQKNNVERQRTALAELYNHKEDIQRFSGTAYGVMMAVTDFAGHFIPARKTSGYRENNFMSLVDGGKDTLIERASAYWK